MPYLKPLADIKVQTRGRQLVFVLVSRVLSSGGTGSGPVGKA
ncbi:hypothetical protein [Amycolatopsis sp. NPDC050768]